MTYPIGSYQRIDKCGNCVREVAINPEFAEEWFKFYKSLERSEKGFVEAKIQQIAETPKIRGNWFKHFKTISHKNKRPHIYEIKKKTKQSNMRIFGWFFKDYFLLLYAYRKKQKQKSPRNINQRVINRLKKDIDNLYR